jgi:hypothetical protein
VERRRKGVFRNGKQDFRPRGCPKISSQISHDFMARRSKQAVSRANIARRAAHWVARIRDRGMDQRQSRGETISEKPQVWRPAAFQEKQEIQTRWQSYRIFKLGASVGVAPPRFLLKKRSALSVSRPIGVAVWIVDRSIRTTTTICRAKLVTPGRRAVRPSKSGFARNLRAITSTAVANGCGLRRGILPRPAPAVRSIVSVTPDSNFNSFEWRIVCCGSEHAWMDSAVICAKSRSIRSDGFVNRKLRWRSRASGTSIAWLNLMVASDGDVGGRCGRQWRC